MRVAEAKYPVGIQTFEDLIDRGCLYADKTALIHRLVSTNKYVFLSRPRRFGKSLLCSTFKSYFEGRRDLFKGLAVERLESQWKKHPVIHLSLASVKEINAEETANRINSILGWIEKELCLPRTSDSPGDRLKDLITGCVGKYGEKAVVIVDEYDAPLLNVLHDPEELTKVRQLMRTLYSPLKDCDPWLRFVFITGITKFSQLSIFSELNNLAHITMEAEYSALCGITQHELETTFSGGVDDLADRLELNREQTLARLKESYDGYVFAAKSEGVYNPFSLLNALQDRKLNNYWFATGTPTFLVEQLRHFGADITSIDGSEAKASEFDSPTEGMSSILPLFYQSGYLTIKDYDSELDVYTLGFPNKEVRVGLMESLFPFYVPSPPQETRSAALTAVRAMLRGDTGEAMDTLKTFFASVPYQDDSIIRREAYYRSILYVVFSLLGSYVACEARTNKGAIDVLLKTSKHIYIIECKLDRSAHEALEQIKRKGYASQFAGDQRTVHCVGVNFSSDERNITEWIEDIGI